MAWNTLLLATAALATAGGSTYPKSGTDGVVLGDSATAVVKSVASGTDGIKLVVQWNWPWTSHYLPP